MMGFIMIMTNAIYCTTNFYAIRDLMEVLTGELFHKETATIWIAAVIFVCEMAGGFEASDTPPRPLLPP